MYGNEINTYSKTSKLKNYTLDSLKLTRTSSHTRISLNKFIIQDCQTNPHYKVSNNLNTIKSV